MKKRPILFSGPMVRSILDGRKTQTRRGMRIQPRHEPSVQTDNDPRDGHAFTYAMWDGGRGDAACVCPYGSPGDWLWVRETWMQTPGGPAYKADGGDHYGAGGRLTWKPSIHMSRSASRITLEIVKVRVERLQEITENDAVAEGAPALVEEDSSVTCGRHKTVFVKLWDKLNAKRGYGWDNNPWVWVIEFKRI